MNKRQTFLLLSCCALDLACSLSSETGEATAVYFSRNPSWICSQENSKNFKQDPGKLCKNQFTYHMSIS